MACKYSDYKAILLRVRAVTDRGPLAQQVLSDCSSLRLRIKQRIDSLVDEMQFGLVEKCDLTLKMFDDELKAMNRKLSKRK